MAVSADDLEHLVVSLMRGALQIEVPARDADLISLGVLDSLAVVTLIAEIETTIGVELPLDEFDVDDFRTVERIVGYLATVLSGRQSPAPAALSGGNDPR